MKKHLILKEIIHYITVHTKLKGPNLHTDYNCAKRKSLKWHKYIKILIDLSTIFII